VGFFFEEVTTVTYIAGSNNAFAGSGTGTPLRNAGAPSNGANGTYAGQNAGPGALLNDITNGKLYQNTGTAASPTWTVVGSES
jgi:hypothetical protein